jgi:hypothetical protein
MYWSIAKKNIGYLKFRLSSNTWAPGKTVLMFPILYTATRQFNCRLKECIPATGKKAELQRRWENMGEVENIYIGVVNMKQGYVGWMIQNIPF